MKIKSLVVCLSLPALLITLSGCSTPAHSPDEKYYFVATNIKLPYWDTAKNGFLHGTNAMKVTGEMVGPDNYDPQAEQQEFQRVEKLKPAGILVSAAGASLLKADINKAILDGVPVITVDSDSPESKRLFFVGTNNYQAGHMGGVRLAQLLKDSLGSEKGNVVVFSMPDQANLADRLKGYKDALADHPAIKMTEIVDIKGDARVAFDTTQEILTKRKDKVDAFVCLEASAGQEVAEVLHRANITNKVILAFDTNDETLKWIQQHVIAATIAQKPWSMSYIALQMLDHIHHNPLPALDHNFAADTFSTLPNFVDTGATLIDFDNVTSFLKERQSSKEQ
jgi:ribose transport system substrate-binding protein